MDKVPVQIVSDSSVFLCKFCFDGLLVCVCSVVGTPFYLMGYVSGRVLKDPSLRGIPIHERRGIYKRMPEILASIHSVDIEKADLSNFGKFGNVWK